MELKVTAFPICCIDYTPRVANPTVVYTFHVSSCFMEFFLFQHSIITSRKIDIIHDITDAGLPLQQ
jgi:hypothetical protein